MWMLNTLEVSRRELHNRRMVVIQKCVRRFLAKSYDRKRDVARVKLQAATRGWLQRTRTRALRIKKQKIAAEAARVLVLEAAIQAAIQQQQIELENQNRLAAEAAEAAAAFAATQIDDADAPVTPVVSSLTVLVCREVFFY